MIRLATIVLGVLVAGAVAYCIYYYRFDLGLVNPESHRETEASEASNSAVPTNRSAQVAWQTINRPADGFKIDMPCGISEIRIPAYAWKGITEPVETIEASPGPEATFAISWSDNPPVERAGHEDAERTLDLALSGALARSATVLLSQSRDTLDGYPARDFTARGDRGILMARLILVRTRLYLLVAAFPSAAAAHEDDADRFFGSFTLTASAPASR